MTTQFFGERITRNEDPRLLTGRALFVDDVQLPNMAHVAFVRSQYAHARIVSVDAAAAASTLTIRAWAYWLRTKAT